MKKKGVIIFTGGGSGGHLVPALTLIEELGKEGEWDISFIGPYREAQKQWVESKGVKYYPISTGKLRRYWSWENIKDIFRLARGIVQAHIIIRKYYPRDALLFSMGGFGSLPAIIAGYFLRRKIYIHEQTTRAGLAGRISAKLAHKIFISFSSSRPFFPEKKTIFSGYPLPQECFKQQIRSNTFSALT